MVHYMKAIEKMINLMEKVGLFIPMEIFMKVNGLMIKQMVKDSIYIKMELSKFIFYLKVLLN